MNGLSNSLTAAETPAADLIRKTAPDQHGDPANLQAGATASFAAILQNTIGASGFNLNETKSPEPPVERQAPPEPADSGDSPARRTHNPGEEESATVRQHEREEALRARGNDEREKEQERSDEIDSRSARDTQSKTEQKESPERTNETAGERGDDKAAARNDDKKNRADERSGKTAKQSEKKGKGAETVDLKNFQILSELKSDGFIKKIEGAIGAAGKDEKKGERATDKKERSLQNRMPIEELIKNLENQTASNKSTDGTRMVYLNPEKWSVQGKAAKKNRTDAGQKGDFKIETFDRNGQFSVQKPTTEGTAGSGDPRGGLNGFNLFRGPTHQALEGRATEATPQNPNRNSFNEMVARARLNMGSDGRSSATIRLNPRHLGQMTLNLDMRDNQLQARLLVDSAEVKKMVMGEIDLLRHDLARHGITMENFSVRLREPDSLNEQAFLFDPGHEGAHQDQGDSERDEGWERGERGADTIARTDELFYDYGYEMNHLPFGGEFISRETVNISI